MILIEIIVKDILMVVNVIRVVLDEIDQVWTKAKIKKDTFIYVLLVKQLELINGDNETLSNNVQVFDFKVVVDFFMKKKSSK